MEPTQQILPGSWLGVFGGGQLGRMFAQSAYRLGYRVAVLDSEVDCPAAQVAQLRYGSTSLADGVLDPAVEDWARRCQVVTLEFENVDSQAVRRAAQWTRTCPDVQFLEICQDRQREKESVQRIGCPTTPFRVVTSEQQAAQAAGELGWPLVLKTARSGYDGKGQRLVRSLGELPEAWSSLATERAVAEQWIDFVAEVSMITARNQQGQIVSYPLLENEHAHHILDVTRCPASPSLQALEPQAREICRSVAESFSVVGLFCVEFFVTRDGRLLINELAPRPHNSGHLTIEAFDISQFEMQLRAICNLPLRPPRQLSPAAMANLLGDLWQAGEPVWEAAFERSSTYLHLYGKSQPRAGRKMGHLTVLDPQRAADLVRQVRDQLQAAGGYRVTTLVPPRLARTIGLLVGHFVFGFAR